MKVRQINNGIEKRIITGMVVDDRFLKEVRTIYKPDLLAVPYARTVAEWCVEFHEQYDKAPGRHVQDIYESKRRDGLPEAQADLIEEFLAGLSDEWEHAEAGKFNAEYLLDETEKRFKAQALKMLTEDIDALLESGDVAGAEQLRIDFKPPERPSSLGVDPFTDEQLIFSAFDDSSEDELFRLPGALGRLIGPIVREDFIGVMGPEKRGKSWRLLDFAMRALKTKCNVAYFDAGDNSEKQATRRIHIYNTARSNKHWGRMKYPVFDCAYNQDDSCQKRERRCKFGVMESGERLQLEDTPDYVPCTECMRDERRDYKGAVWHEWIETEQLTAAYAFQEGKRVIDRSRKRYKLSCHPNSTLTVAMMETILDRWEHDEGFVPDVILADYFDIFAPENPRIVDERQKQNETWKAGRRLSQKRRCAVITATQADADSYAQKTIREKNFSEDKRKYGHVTRMVTLNQTDDEKRDGVMRIGTMFVREDDYITGDTVTVLQALRIGQPYLGSF